MKRRILLSLALVAIVALPHVRAAQNTAANKAAPPPRPALPPLRSLKTEPASLTLDDGRDERRVLVWGESASGQRFDVTDDAVLKSESPEIEIDNTGYIRPKGQGQAEVTVAIGALKTKVPVTIKDAAVPEIHFVRDVQPVLSKLGCNAGTCHGAAKGKNGFKLSLRGQDPELDYVALTHDLFARRLDPLAPEQSLILLKPTTQIAHEGGLRHQHRRAGVPHHERQPLHRIGRIERRGCERRPVGDIGMDRHCGHGTRQDYSQRLLQGDSAV